jgi:hypothetical protein
MKMTSLYHHLKITAFFCVLEKRVLAGVTVNYNAQLALPGPDFLDWAST